IKTDQIYFAEMQNSFFLSIDKKQCLLDWEFSSYKLISLDQLTGKKVLLLFFPLAFTSVCTAESCLIRDNYKVYEDLNAVL
ncbi:MAG TPA: redoxin domain-containing protein, partial [Flavisolibacter sp.]|nr:redoxin domain-containing protein [Flavisolibacter sp.]